MSALHSSIAELIVARYDAERRVDAAERQVAVYRKLLVLSWGLAYEREQQLRDQRQRIASLIAEIRELRDSRAGARSRRAA